MRLFSAVGHWMFGRKRTQPTEDVPTAPPPAGHDAPEFLLRKAEDLRARAASVQSERARMLILTVAEEYERVAARRAGQHDRAPRDPQTARSRPFRVLWGGRT